MRYLRFTLWGVLLALVTASLIGCDDSASAPEASKPAATTSPATDQQAQTADKPADKSAEKAGEDERSAPDAGDDEPDLSNVLTRSPSRFHDAFPSDEAFLQWVETFYIHKQFERTPQAMGYFCSSKLYDDYLGRVPMADFFGAVLRQSDDTVDRCYNELMLEGRVPELTLLGFAAWFADTPHSRQMIIQARKVWLDDTLVRMLHTIYEAKVVDTMDREVDKDPRAISMLWYEFFATGDEARLRKAVEHSYMFNAPEGTWQRAAGEVAHAQLVRVLPYDPTVRRIVEDEAAHNPMTAIRTHLAMMLKEAGPLRERPEIPAAP